MQISGYEPPNKGDKKKRKMNPPSPCGAILPMQLIITLRSLYEGIVA